MQIGVRGRTGDVGSLTALPLLPHVPTKWRRRNNWTAKRNQAFERMSPPTLPPPPFFFLSAAWHKYTHTQTIHCVINVTAVVIQKQLVPISSLVSAAAQGR